MVSIVAEAYKKDGELYRDRELGAVGVVVEDIVWFNDINQCIENHWRDPKFLAKTMWGLVSKICEVQV